MEICDDNGSTELVSALKRLAHQITLVGKPPFRSNTGDLPLMVAVRAGAWLWN